jgi:hypothetical protein
MKPTTVMVSPDETLLPEVTFGRHAGQHGHGG